MSDFRNLLESGIEINGVYQRYIPVMCYLDIPIKIIIKKLELMDKSNDFFKFLNRESPVIIEWLESNPDNNFEIQDYIDFLQTHLQTTRDFVRFALDIFPGVYAKNPAKDIEIIGLDEDYIEWYNDLVSYIDLDMDSISTDIDLRTIPSSQVRPTLKWEEDLDENIKTIFVKTSFQIGTKMLG